MMYTCTGLPSQGVGAGVGAGGAGVGAGLGGAVGAVGAGLGAGLGGRIEPETTPTCFLGPLLSLKSQHEPVL